MKTIRSLPSLRIADRHSLVISVLALFLLAMALAACAVGPDYVRPDATEIPEGYTGVSDEWKIAVPQAHIPKGKWWEVFGDLELNKLEEAAAAANQDLKAAYARFNQARAAANVTQANLFPKLSGSYLPVRQLDSLNRPAGGHPGQTYNTDTVLFDLSYEVDLWGRVRRLVESATAQVQASADDVEAVKLAIQAEVAADYFAIRALDGDKDLLLRSIEVFRKSFELVSNRRAGGMVSDLDVAQAETVLRNTESQLPDTALQRAKFEHALAVLTGQNASFFRVSERPLDLKPVILPPNLPSELLERRPDIAAAERRMAAANASIGVATAAFFPTIRFGAQTGYQSGTTSNLLDWQSRFWTVAPSITLPLFQGGQLVAGLDQARAAYEEAVAKYRQTVLSAFADVENNLSAEYLLANQHERVVAASKSGRRQLEVANNRYEAGLVTYLDVATAENVTLGIDRTAMRLRGQQLVSVIALIKSLGGSWMAD